MQTTITRPEQEKPLNRAQLIKRIKADIAEMESGPLDEPALRALERKRDILKLLDIPRVVADSEDGRVIGDRVSSSWFRSYVDRRFFVVTIAGSLPILSVTDDFGTLVGVWS